MLQMRNATVSNGQRYTFRVKRYSMLRKMGWSAHRLWGQIFFFPPGTTDYLEDSFIQKMLENRPCREVREFRLLCQATPMAETTNATLPGVFWDGRNLFSVGSDADNVSVTPIEVTSPKGKFIGIEVDFVSNGSNNTYWLVTDCDVDLRTFYKYLLFQKHRISTKIIRGLSQSYATMPYSRDKRLEVACTVKPLLDTLTL